MYEHALSIERPSPRMKTGHNARKGTSSWRKTLQPKRVRFLANDAPIVDYVCLPLHHLTFLPLCNLSSIFREEKRKKSAIKGFRFHRYIPDMTERSVAQHNNTDTPFCTIRKSHVTWNFAVPGPHSEEIRRCILLFLWTLGCSDISDITMGNEKSNHQILHKKYHL